MRRYSPQAQRRTGRSMRRKKILIIDDDPAFSGTIFSLLDRMAYEPTRTHNPSQAIDLLEQRSDFDVVLLEIQTTGSDGMALLDVLRTEYPHTPVIVLTVVNDIHLVTEAFRRGAINYLLKPSEPHQLIHAIEHAAEQGRMRKHEADYRRNLEELVAVRTGRLQETMQDLERSYDTTLEAMGDALDLRDAETEGHSKRVTAYTIALARAVGYDLDDLRTLARGAFLHDIGKIATPDRILLKPGKLDPQEMAIMREHCVQGYRIVRKIPFLREASEIVYAHQERFDGEGYPRRLRAEEIPLGARIFAIADTLDAITSDRPYRSGATVQAATAEIARCTGTQFDPAIVDVFLSLPSDLWNDLRIEVSQLAAEQMPSRLYRAAVA
jgi:putative nucleotidyltransferase with HDIG domain